MVLDSIEHLHLAHLFPREYEEAVRKSQEEATPKPRRRRKGGPKKEEENQDAAEDASKPSRVCETCGMECASPR